MQTLTNSGTIAQVHKKLRLQKWFGCSNFALLLYVGFCLTLAMASYLRPLPTFDRYLYAGAVASLRYSDPVIIHRIARAEFDAQPSPFVFENVTAEPYFADIRDNPYHFTEQLGLFRVKLGYVASGYVLWRAGLPILIGLRLISACCLLIAGLAILSWTHDALLSLMLLLTPPVLSMGRMATADPLSTTIVIFALFALTRKRNLLAASLLIVSILVRSDNMMLAVICFAWMIWRQRIRFSVGVLFAILAVIATALINRYSGAAGWRVIMQHGFVKPVIEPISHPVLISFSGYLHALAGLKAIPYTFMTVWILVGAAVWKQLPRKSIFRDLLPLTGFYIVIRLVIFPNFDDRFFVWAYLLSGIALIRRAGSSSSTAEEEALCCDL
jgi:hypothetical protein